MHPYSHWLIYVLFLFACKKRMIIACVQYNTVTVSKHDDDATNAVYITLVQVCIKTSQKVKINC